MKKPLSGLFGVAASVSVGLSLLIPAVSSAATTFTSQTYPTGGGPESVAAGDFNGDGFLDLVTANVYGSTVSVLLNDGHGAYGAHTDLSLGSQPHEVRVADINGDGKQDIIGESESNGGDVFVALGNGDGTFAPPITTTTSMGGASSIQLADVNGDGKLDAVVAFQYSNIVEILLGDGTGHFATPISLSVAGGPDGVAFADMNGDGHMDLVISHAGDGNVGIMLGDGLGNFGPQAVFPTGIAGGNGGPKTADFNGDGKQDVVVSDSAGIVLMLGDGLGGLGAGTVISPGGVIGVVDITGDGKPDIEAADASTNTAFVLKGNGDGTFSQSASFPTGAYPFANGVVQDLNNDGKLDLAVPDLNDNTVAVLLNTTPVNCGALPGVPVSCWRAEGNTNDGADGNNGVISGGVSYAPGISGQAFQFNGIDGSVDAGNAANLHISSGDFTVGAWVKFNATGGDMSIMDKSSGINADGWRLIKQADNRFWFCFGAGENQCFNSTYTLFSTTVASVDTWYYVVATKSAGTFSLYVNGALQDSRPVPSFFDTNTTDLLLGSNATQGAHLNGSLDEAVIYNRALTPAEIAADYSSLPPAPTTGSLTVDVASVGGDGVFQFNGSLGAFSITTDPNTQIGQQSFSGLQPGTYSISETTSDGWVLTTPGCDNVAVVAGQNTECAIRFTKLGRILIKNVEAGGSANINFTSSYSPGTFSLGNGQQNDSGYLSQAVYTVTEAVPSGWSLTTACDDGSNPANVFLQSGRVVTCTFTNTKQGPTITTTLLPADVVGSAYSQTLQETGGTSPFTWSITSGTLPAGVTLSAAGVLSGTPTASSTRTFTVKVVDANNASSTQILSLQIVKPLVLNTASLPTGKVGNPYSKALVAAQGLPPYTWTVTGGALPDGLSLNPSSGIVSGTPTTAAVGTSNVTIQVSDNATQTASKSYSVTISALHITTASLPNGKVGAGYSKILAAAGGTTPLTWSLTTGAFPSGFTLNPSGLISGNTTAQGTFNVTIQVSDTNGITDTMSYSFDVTAVHVTTANVPNGVVGAPYSKNLAAAGGTVPYTWSHYAGTLPSGLSIDQAGAVVGTPTSVGTFNFTVRVIDANGIADYKGFTTTIAKTTITTASLPNGKVNNAYNKTMAANSGTAPYSWSVTGGALPTGLTLSTGGVISGTPTVAGTASVTIQAADANGINDSQNYSLLIKP